ncbi:hypothetical protein BX616_003508 [Lobosporangium transversale]|uniref:Pre-mRNA-splicing factor of RES complex-domain-containing protein n=1 Tax=Lobosporangium transversale TaxID=64571 RepID=A0A1Y2GU37_9FUNG|nr:Pre-mRNA-splicing factor of RES complex-domain-containing protein [Lobosporangium transversale]KAF9916536.1 hypothetical protein BX616_003508 [Lobosporangium transversale]ORZ23759.1 Pre-mRNA-splicing factor of RES complex-domain-containing protein [Lobosporangium transversale]|eukprot:XP_021883573.1 Pre-mRNA-splicing factor of RES complex-domain-containing protein [Lobosporangium transversale]
MSTQDYLKKYMTKSTSVDENKKHKSKKKKITKAIVRKGNFAIHDEDGDTWRTPASESEDDIPIIEQPKAPVYKSSSSNWTTIREGEPEPSREEKLQRNVLPEWDDVEDEDERPAIAGIVVETESSARLRKTTKSTKESSKPKERWRESSKPIMNQDHSPAQDEHTAIKRKVLSPSPPLVRGRLSEPSRGYRHSSSLSRSRSRSPIQQKRRRSSSRSPSPYSRREDRSPSSPSSRARSVERMSSGAAVGLQTATQVKYDLQRRQQEHQEKMNTLDPTKSGRDSETVYRDAQGRKIDRVQEKIEKAEAARREIEKQERMMEWGKGLVQREEEAEKKRREEEEKFKPLARYMDDEELNEELKERERWNDPAARFLSGTKKTKKAVRRYPIYQGNIPPNRFNIRPGYRWDGVDRSNGFEKSYFQRINTQKNRAMEAHLWSVEDM